MEVYISNDLKISIGDFTSSIENITYLIYNYLEKHLREK